MSLLTAQELFQDLQEEQTTHAPPPPSPIKYDDDSSEDPFSFDDMSSDSSYNDLSVLHQQQRRATSHFQNPNIIAARAPPRRSSLSRFIGHAAHPHITNHGSLPLNAPNAITGVCLPFISPNTTLIASPLSFKAPHSRHQKRAKTFNLLDTLPMEEQEVPYGEIEVYREGGTHINLMPQDTIRHIFSFFALNDLISCGQVCHLWYNIHRHDILWERWLRERNNGNLRYSMFSAGGNDGTGTLLLTEYYRRYKKKRKKQKQYTRRDRRKYAQFQEDSTADASAKKKNPNTSYFRTYRRIMRDKKRLKKLKKKQIKREKLRKHYESLFKRPQKISEAFYLCVYNPLFFIAHLFSTVALALYLDRITPHTEWYLLIVLFPIVSVDVGYFLAMMCAIITDLLSSFRRNRNFNGMVSMLYLGNVWLPVSMFLMVLKLYIWPPSTPWRMAFAPLWVFCCIYSITSIILRMQIRFLKWGTDQKVMWAGTALLNTVVTFTTAFLATVLDDSRMALLIDHVYSTFVFTPIWFLLVVSLIAIPVFGYAFLHEFGFFLTMVVYGPASCLFVLPWIPFFIMLALQMDGLIKIPYLVIFSPLLFWEACGVLTAIGLALVTRKTGFIP